MKSRRDVLKRLGATAAGMVVGGAAVAATSAASASSDLASADASRPSTYDPAASDPAGGAGPWWLLAPLRRGSHLAGSWFIAHLSSVQRGASVLTLQHRDGAVARVHLCYREGPACGLASTTFLDLVLMDGRQGGTDTDELLGRVVLGLADHIRGNEVFGAGDLAALGALQPHDQRVLDHGPETLT